MADSTRHDTPHLAIEDFRLGNMAPQTYSTGDISKAVIGYLKQPKDQLSDTQIRGLKRWKKNVTSNHYNPENDMDLQKWFDIFNDVFFNRILEAYCKLEWFEEEKLRNAGYVDRTKVQGEKPQVTIFVLKRKEWLTWEIICSYMDVLVHEMLHAVFAIFSCGCNSCTEIGDRESEWGHHPNWLAAALAVEKFCNYDINTKEEGFGNRGIDLIREKNLAYEIV